MKDFSSRGEQQVTKKQWDTLSSEGFHSKMKGWVSMSDSNMLDWYQRRKIAIGMSLLVTRHLEYCVPVLGSSVQERHRHTGVTLVKDHKDG